jgi:hypothetical protein
MTPEIGPFAVIVTSTSDVKYRTVTILASSLPRFVSANLKVLRSTNKYFRLKENSPKNGNAIIVAIVSFD